MRWLRRSVRRKILFVSVCVVVQIGLFFVCQAVVRQITARKFETRIQEKEAIIEAAGRIAYVTKQEINAGERFSEENVEKRYVLSEQNADILPQEVLGMRACADMPVGVIVSTMLCDEGEYTPSERRCVFHNLSYAECFSAYEVVDVRIRYANGENYCVLKKKRLQRTTEDLKESVFFLTEEEQLLMSAAQYDVELYQGAELYLVGFVEERLQEDAISEYLPSLQVLAQLKGWKEEYRQDYEARCDSRRALEKRLSEHRKLRLNDLW